MKEKIINHYERTIRKNQINLEECNDTLSRIKKHTEFGLSDEGDEQAIKFWQDKVDICERNIKSLTEQLEYIKANLK